MKAKDYRAQVESGFAAGQRGDMLAADAADAPLERPTSGRGSSRSSPTRTRERMKGWRR